MSVEQMIFHAQCHRSHPAKRGPGTCPRHADRGPQAGRGRQLGAAGCARILALAAGLKGDGAFAPQAGMVTPAQKVHGSRLGIVGMVHVSGSAPTSACLTDRRPHDAAMAREAPSFNSFRVALAIPGPGSSIARATSLAPGVRTFACAGFLKMAPSPGAMLRSSAFTLGHQ